MSSPYLEEQVRALAKMCEAMIVHIHFTGNNGEMREGHNAYPASGCHAEVCKGYAEGYRGLHFSRRDDVMAEMRGTEQQLLERITELEEQLGIEEVV
jgi:hypothetical protein